MSKSWYNMTPAKAADGAAEILLYDVIGGWGKTAKDFAADLKAIAGASITLRINSPGGDVMEGAAIYNLLKADGRQITVHIDGLAASMASVIAMAGNKVVMPANALMMIHNPWTVSMGNAEQLRKDAALLDKISNQLVGAYQAKCGDKKKREDIQSMMDAETWMDGNEAVAAGFADECGEAIKAAACAVDTSKLEKNIDARLNAILPKGIDNAQSSSKPATTPPAPVLIDAATVQARVDAEVAAALACGRAERQPEIDALAKEREDLKASVAQAQATITTLAATVAAEKSARLAAEKAHAMMMGGAHFTPEAAPLTWEDAVSKLGYEKAAAQCQTLLAEFRARKRMENSNE